MAPRFNPKSDLVDLKGQVIIVTGANRPWGLGYSTVKHLVSAGAKVYIAARNEQQSLESIEKLKADLRLGEDERSAGEVHFLKLDLADPRNAKKVAEEFLMKESRLDVLVNNPAMVFAPYEKTNDGISKIVVTNLISPFVFTKTLLPLMAKTAQEKGSDVRIVNISSLSHKFVPNIKELKKPEDLNQDFRRRPLAKFTRYAHTKTLIIIWTRALHQHLKSLSSTMPGVERVVTMAIDPGNIDTFSNRWPLPWLWRPLVRLLMSAPNVDVGAYPTVFAAAGKKIHEDPERYSGVYLDVKMKVANPSRNARSDKLAEDLWILVEEITNDMGV
ncbi:hypothetical protein EV360DRAFT_80466 [Lentinula raphanica]|nr:hypothetical protein EV360DRAFT_80466 [Lentinula raphanica]